MAVLKKVLKEQRMREGSQWYEKEVNKVIEETPEILFIKHNYSVFIVLTCKSITQVM